MIIEVKLANYRSIHAEQTLSFVAEKARRHPDNLIKRPGYRLLKAAALFGANASGKSNFVRAIGEMRDFVRDSATKMNDGDPIECAQPYRLDPESRDKPSRFEITFVTDGTQYTYGFAATRERVHEEWLTATRENSKVKLFDFKRSHHSVAKKMAITVNDTQNNATHLLADRTRDNALFLSVAARENVKELLPVYRFIVQKILFYNLAGLYDKLIHDAKLRYHIDNKLAQTVQSLLHDADLGIDSLGYKQGEFQSFRIDTNGETVAFNFDEAESVGTQRLFGLAYLFVYVLRNGRFLVLDELDASMHPLLTRRLLEMFQSTQANPNGAQLLFTTHDAVLLDSVLFRRDQIILAEKQGNESRFYPLADIVPPPRNTESFLNNYLVGRYGGTPYFGPAFDTLTVEGKK